MISVSTYEAKTKLSELLRLVKEKDEVVRICKHGRVMAELVSPRRMRSRNKPFKRHPRIMGVKINCDLTCPALDETELPDYMR